MKESNKKTEGISFEEQYEKFFCVRIDQLDQAAIDFLNTFLRFGTDCNSEKAEWNQDILGEILDYAEQLLSKTSHGICRPYYTEDDVPCYRDGCCENKNCPFKN